MESLDEDEAPMGRRYFQRRDNPQLSDGSNADEDDKDGNDMAGNQMELAEEINEKK